MLVEIYPQLITPTTISDPNLRKTLLQCGADPVCGTNGVILNFYFSELDGDRISRTARWIVTLPVIHYRPARVDGSVSDWFDMGTDTDPAGRHASIRHGHDKITANVLGVDLGTDQDLTLAIQLDQGNTTTLTDTGI